MTVAEIINELQKYPDNKEVFFSDYGMMFDIETVESEDSYRIIDSRSLAVAEESVDDD